jgi:N-acylneuraminate cytidylyltransferase
MEVIGIIPARGGSKGIEKKNIVPFLGEPLITHTIEQAHQSELIDDVYVSTDNPEISSVSQNAGAKVIERPEAIAGDEASTESALLHALTVLDHSPDVVVLLQCTSPLRRPGDIDAAIEMVTQGDYESALSCCEDHKFYWREEDSTGVSINYDPETRKRRQDMEKRYQESGSISVVRTHILQETECRLGGEIGIYEMPEILSFEIDTPEDLTIVSTLARESRYELCLR